MLIAIVNGQTVEQVGDYQVLFPNTSFPASGPTPEWMAENSCLPVTVYLPYDPATQYLESVAPYINSDVVYTVEVQDMTPEQLAAYRQSIAQQYKAQAQSLLSQTDWTAIPDVADPAKSDPYLTNQAEFVSWRSVIRAIAVNPTYDAFFPTKPNEQWSNQLVSKATIGTTTASFTINT
jgi:hypothetical protein